MVDSDMDQPEAKWLAVSREYARDRLLVAMIAFTLPLYVLAVTGYADAALPLGIAANAVYDTFNTLWWGVALGVVFIGILGRVPRQAVIGLLGEPGSFRSLLRAAGAGVLLDLCSHGILMVGTKLYERGASAGQVMAFLIASPWNSFSLTLIMFTLFGVGWTMLFIALSLLIGLSSGWLIDRWVASGRLPDNPNRLEIEHYPGRLVWAEFKAASPGSILREGVQGARMVVRWLLFGVALVAAVRAFVPASMFAEWFGPTFLGLLATLGAATLLEVCSEGSVPIAGDLMHRTHAPGNSFAFLLAGVATDYTEVMAIKETSHSWKLALALPFVTLPQVLVLAVILNNL